MTTDQMAILLRKQSDPAKSASKLTVKEVVRVYPVDGRGLTEALYRDRDGTPLTAFMRGKELAYVVDGW